MIKNERQYRITKAQAENFCQTIVTGIHFFRRTAGLKTAIVDGKRNSVQQRHVSRIKRDVEENVARKTISRATTCLLRSHGVQRFFLTTFRTA